MGLIEPRIAEAIVRDIVPHGFISSLRQHLQTPTCSSPEAARPIARRGDFAELLQFLLLLRGLTQTVEAALSLQNVVNLKVIPEYSVDQQDFSFVKTDPDRDSNLLFHSRDLVH